MDEDFTNALKSAKTVDEFLSIIDKAENGDAKQEEIPTISEATKKILAVTGCKGAGLRNQGRNQRFRRS